MSQQTANPPQGGAYERCLCREAVDRFRELMLPRSEEARAHLRNSRIEFLKAVRSLIDERISHLSSAGQPGSKVPVE